MEPCTSDKAGHGSGDRPPFTAVILNGGNARRYGGADKQSLTVGDRTIGYLLASTLRGEARELLVVGRPHAMYQGISDGQREDALKGQGPLEGLRIAMRHASYSWILLCAADMPFASPPLIHRLYDIAVKGESEIVLCEFADRCQPFSAFYRKDLYSALTTYLESQSSLSIWNFIRTRRFEMLPSAEVTEICDAELAFQNINDPISYARALEIAKRRGFTTEARV